MNHAQQGDTVRIHFTGRLDNGSVFGSSQQDEPVQLTLGSEQMIAGLEKALVGMEVGEKKTVTVPAEQGFGPRRPELQQEVARAALPQDAKIGDRLSARAGERPVYVWVRELKEDKATVDGNHPLAGQTLTFDVEMVSIETSDAQG